MMRALLEIRDLEVRAKGVPNFRKALVCGLYLSSEKIRLILENYPSDTRQV
jgi:hypothetical protein